MLNYNGTKVKKLFYNGQKVKKAFCNGVQVFSSEYLQFNQNTVDADYIGQWRIYAWNGSNWTSKTIDTGSVGYVSGTNGNINMQAKLNDNNMLLYCNHSTVGYNGAGIRSELPIDVTNYSKCTIWYYRSGWVDDSKSEWGFTTDANAINGGNPLYTTITTSVSFGKSALETTQELDISNISGEQYFTFKWAGGSANNGKGENRVITKIMLE